MARPSKPVLLLAAENRSHRTNAELAQRKEYEDSLVTGEEIKEWKTVKSDPVAHKEFLRIKKLLKNIKKSDDLFAGSINRYCLLKAECESCEEKRERFTAFLDEMEDRVPADERDTEFYSTISKIQAQVNACDKQVMSKRRMMLDIEKENIMTIASSLRAIPKKPENQSEGDAMDALLKGRRA